MLRNKNANVGIRISRATVKHRAKDILAIFLLEQEITMVDQEKSEQELMEEMLENEEAEDTTDDSTDAEVEDSEEVKKEEEIKEPRTKAGSLD